MRRKAWLSLIQQISMRDQLQLQINLRLGDSKYCIHVPRHHDLPALVEQFLQEHRLSQTYHPTIIQLVEDKLKEEDKRRHQKDGLKHEKNKTGTPFPHRLYWQDQQEKQNEQRAVVNNEKHNLKRRLIQRIEQQINCYENSLDNEPENRKVYEKWRQREKTRIIQKDKDQEDASKRTLQSKKETHSPDHFYHKGKLFKEECRKNCEQQFQKIYPFRTKEVEMNEREKEKLHQRLFKEGKMKMLKSAFLLRGEFGHLSSRDAIKQQVRVADEQIDRGLYEMIKEGQMEGAKRAQSSLAPFRKTVVQ